MTSFDLNKFYRETLVSDEHELTEEQFVRRNLLLYLSSVIFMIFGPLFLYFGFYLLTWPYTVKWGALSIALGLLVLMFGFSLWQDRQIQTLQRAQMKSAEELHRMVQELVDRQK